MKHGERYVTDYTSHIYDKTIITISRRTMELQLIGCGCSSFEGSIRFHEAATKAINFLDNILNLPLYSDEFP